jgi:hypothetical protein
MIGIFLINGYQSNQRPVPARWSQVNVMPDTLDLDDRSTHDPHSFL